VTRHAPIDLAGSRDLIARVTAAHASDADIVAVCGLALRWIGNRQREKKAQEQWRRRKARTAAGDKRVWP
jgi:hypothetical protein